VHNIIIKTTNRSENNNQNINLLQKGVFSSIISTNVAVRLGSACQVINPHSYGIGES
jgi:hypothetical protein